MDTINKMVQENIPLDVIFGSFFVNYGLRNAYLIDDINKITDEQIDLIPIYLPNTKIFYNKQYKITNVFVVRSDVELSESDFDKPDHQELQDFVGELLGFSCPGDAERCFHKEKYGISIYIIYNSLPINLMTMVCCSYDDIAKEKVNKIVDKVEQIIEEQKLDVTAELNVTKYHSIDYFIKKLVNKLEFETTEEISQFLNILANYSFNASIDLINEKQGIYFNDKFVDHLINVMILIKTNSFCGNNTYDEMVHQYLFQEFKKNSAKQVGGNGDVNNGHKIYKFKYPIL